MNWEEDFFFDNVNQTSPFSTMFDPDEVDIDFDSDIYSIEFMFRRPVTSGITFMIGPRFVSFREDLQFDTFTEVMTPLGAVSVTIESSSQIGIGLISEQEFYLVTSELNFVEHYLSRRFDCLRPTETREPGPLTAEAATLL